LQFALVLLLKISMFEIDIPGFGPIQLEYLVCDFTGTISVDGNLFPLVKERLNGIASFLKIFVLTADEFGKAEDELKGVNCEVHIIKGRVIDAQKEEFVRNLGADKVVVFGNGLNDRKCSRVPRLAL